MVEPVVAVTRRVVLAVLAALVAVTVVVPSSAATKGAATKHEPPYKKGPSGGDEFNYVEVDPQSGTVRVVRLFPGIPPVVGCTPEPAAGWAMLRVKHHVDKEVNKVTVNFDAQLESYAWVMAALRGRGGRWFGVEKLQGPHFGESKLVVRPHHPVPVGSEMIVEFGVQLGDACPQLGAGFATFPSVVIE